VAAHLGAAAVEAGEKEGSSARHSAAVAMAAEFWFALPDVKFKTGRIYRS